MRESAKGALVAVLAFAILALAIVFELHRRRSIARGPNPIVPAV